MKCIRLILYFLFIAVMVLNHETSLKAQQSEDEILEMRKKMLKKFPFPENSIELENKFSFPSKELEEEGTYLFEARFISNDSSGNIYVSNSREHRILKFDPSGNLLAKIGQKGQGPGEFISPKRVMPRKDFVVVHDSRNYRIQFLDQNGNYVKSFKVYKIYWDMAMNDDGLIFAAPIRMDKNSLLIDVLSQDGKLLYSFGEPKDLKYDWSDLNIVKLTFNKRGELLVAFHHFPIVRKYSPEGKLLAEFKIDYKIMNFKEKMNLDANNSRGSKGKTGYALIISAIQAADEGFYILHEALRVEILEFDKNGKLKCAYWNEELDEKHLYLVNDFLVQNRGDEKIFYILQSLPENKIDVFGLKHK